MKKLLSICLFFLTLPLMAGVPYVINNNMVPEYWQKPMVFVVAGDGRNVTNDDSLTLTWPRYLLNNAWSNAPIGFFTNTSIGGPSSGNAWALWTNFNHYIGQYLPANNSVTQGLVSVYTGVNDIGNGSNAAQIVYNLSNICRSVRNKGSKVILFKLMTSPNLTLDQVTTLMTVNRELGKNLDYYYDYLVDPSMVVSANQPAGLNLGNFAFSDPPTVDGIHFRWWVDRRVASLVDWTIRNGSRFGALPFGMDGEDVCLSIGAAMTGTLGFPEQNVFFGTQRIRGMGYFQGISGLQLMPSDAGFGTGAILQDNNTVNSSLGIWGRAGAWHFTGMNDITSSAQADGFPDYLKINTVTTNLSLLGHVEMPTNRWPIFPAAPSVGGACMLVNSNGTLYVLTSLPNTATWAATNKIAP